MSEWEDNSIQFPRMLAELENGGHITNEVIDSLSQAMDLTRKEVLEIFDRAIDEFDKIKESI